ncbi:MAG: DegT/DnrJ/EryC1/StrS aminotransferase, partial [Aeromicrobium sp.]|nr:DegT/DnrJ/EryC1/StrS aminotransferase [Aeromicrobium sp.]
QVLDEHDDVAAVVMTHLYGLVGDVERIRTLCDERGVVLVEDCAQAMGAIVDGRPAGTFGDAATISFYPTKNLGAFGDAGAVVSSTSEIHERARSLAQYGWGERYEVTLPGGINSRIDEMQAAVLLEMEASLDLHNQFRRDIVERFAGCVSGDRYFITDSSPRFVGHLAVMVTPTRSADAQQLLSAGVASGVHYPIADNCQPGWKGLVPAASLPVTEWLCDSVLTVPCFPTMTEAQIDLVAAALSAL